MRGCLHTMCRCVQTDRLFKLRISHRSSKYVDEQDGRDRLSKNWKKLIAGACAVGMIMTALAGCTQNSHTDEAAAAKVLKVGSDNYPPYNYLDEDGMPTGIDVELVTEAFKRMGYGTEFIYIDWEQKKNLVESGDIDCIMGCFSMEGRLDDYKWAGSYMVSNQVVAVPENSDIYTLSDLAGKNIAVQSTSKPEGLFLNKTDSRIPEIGTLISLEKRELMFTFLAKNYVDAVAAHETFILEYANNNDVKYRIIDEPLMTVGIGTAFSKHDDRGICEELDKTFAEMREDGTAAEIIGKYLDNPEKFLEVDKLDY